MEKMKYLVAILKTEKAYEGLLMSEGGVILARRYEKEGAEVFRSLVSLFPVKKAAVCISGDRFPLDIPKAFKIRWEEKEEAIMRSAFGEADGALIDFGENIYVTLRKNGIVCEREVPYGASYMAETAIHAGLTGESAWLLCALEERSGMPKKELEKYLLLLSEEERLPFAQLIRKGAFSGEEICLAHVKKSLTALSGTLEEMGINAALSVKGRGLQNADVPVIEKWLKKQFGDGFAFEKSEIPPIYGSVCGAAAEYRKPPDEAFRRRFAETYSLFIQM